MHPPKLVEVPGPITLETPRLVLREFKESDWVDARAWDSDPEVARWQSSDHSDEAQSRRYIEQSMETARATPRRIYELGISVKPDPRLIGRLAFNLDRPEHADATAWFVIRRDQWGKGYVTEAVRALIDFAFTKVGVQRIWADCDPRNTGSWRVMEKVGMRREGHLVKNWWLKGEWCDSYIYAVRVEEWAGSGAKPR
jgi:RimJ/RimL family protein N-acetyltransferase